jgi:hypothetical protein
MRFAAVHTRAAGCPVSALFEADGPLAAVRKVETEGDMWFVMARDDLRLARRPALACPPRGFRPLAGHVLPEYALYSDSRPSRRGTAAPAAGSQ